MKPWNSIAHWLVTIRVPQRVVMFALILVGGGYSAESQDFKTFDAQESYVVEGASIVLTQKVGEATAKLFAPSPGAQSRSALTTTSGANFSRIVELPRDLVIYDVQTSAGRVLSTAENVAAISSLNSDATVAYAFPVYVNPNTGNRVFLNDEIVVKLTASFSRGRPPCQDFEVTVRPNDKFRLCAISFHGSANRNAISRNPR